LSELQLGTQVDSTQTFLSPQSTFATHPTHRPTVRSQTLSPWQSSELTQGVKGSQRLLLQSSFLPQSVLAMQRTHCLAAVSQTGLAGFVHSLDVAQRTTASHLLLAHRDPIGHWESKRQSTQPLSGSQRRPPHSESLLQAGLRGGSTPASGVGGATTASLLSQPESESDAAVARASRSIHKQGFFADMCFFRSSFSPRMPDDTGKRTLSVSLFRPFT